MELTLLQEYWWLLISILAAVLVFLLFVQGGQSMLFNEMSAESRQLMVSSLGRKWELTYTTLVVFGGAFFASFPLFYSTSFGGAYWLWMLILLSFVIQAFSYEFRLKKGNIYSRRTYDTFLVLNGVFGCVLLGVAVGTIFFGAEFTVTKANILNPAAPVISTWVPTHGLEAIVSWKNLLLGFAIFFLARAQAALYFINNIDDEKSFGMSNRIRVMTNGTIFVLLFVGFLVVLFLSDGLRANADGTFTLVNNIYWHNLMDMWVLIPILLLGVLMVVYAIGRASFTSTWRSGIWYSGIGTVLVVVVLFLLAGYKDTAYYRSLTDPASSLTIANSSSSEFTLKTMSYVSIIIPVVIAYIWYTWRRMNRKPLTVADLSDTH